MTPSPNEVERLADAATREIHGDDYRIATRLIIAKALRDVLRSEGREHVSVPVAFVKAAHDYINSRGDSMDNRMTIEATPLTAAPPAPEREGK